MSARNANSRTPVRRRGSPAIPQHWVGVPAQSGGTMVPQQAPAGSDFRYTASRIEVRGKGDGPTIESMSAANAQCHALG